MATVPRYTGQQVSTQALPGVRVATDAPAEAFGAGPSSRRVFQAAENFGQAAYKVEQEERAQANQLRMSEERRALNDWELSNVYDSKSGAITRTGKNAFGLPDELSQNYDKFIQEREKGLANDDQKIAFRQLSEARRESVLKWAAGHLATQTKVVEQSEFEASLESSKERASADPNNAPLETQMIKQQTMMRAQREGWGEEQTAQELRKHETDLHARVVSNMLTNHQDMTASAYFAKVKDRLDPDIARKLQDQLEEGSTRAESQRLTDGIMRQGLGLSAAIQKAKDEAKTPELRDATIDRIRKEFDLRDAAKRDQQERDFLSATNILERGGSYDQIPPAVITRMPMHQRAALRNYAKGADPETDLTTYYDLKTQAATPELREKFLKTNLIDYAGKFSKTDLKEMMDLQAGLRKGDANAEKQLDGFRSDSQIVNDTLKEAGIKGDEEKSLFMRKADEAVALFAKQAGKRPTNQEMQTIVDGLLTKGVTEKGWLWDSSKRAFELQPGESFQIEPNQVPKLERTKIEEALKRAGKPITEAAIAELYSRKLRN